jgi:hypothetical protein
VPISLGTGAHPTNPIMLSRMINRMSSPSAS